jgi:DNA mismatch repair ATPase MutS
MEQSCAADVRQALPPAPEKTVRFFDRREFFSTYGNDAVFIADTFNKTQATVKVRTALARKKRRTDGARAST